MYRNKKGKNKTAPSQYFRIGLSQEAAEYRGTKIALITTMTYKNKMGKKIRIDRNILKMSSRELNIFSRL
jgi:hypothetical protein